MKAIFFIQDAQVGSVAVSPVTGVLEFASDIDPALKTAVESVASQLPLVFVATHTRLKQTDIVPVESGTQPLKFLELLVSEVASLGYEGSIVDETVDEQLSELLHCLPAEHMVRSQTEAYMDRMSILEKTALIEILQEQFGVLSRGE